MARVGRHAKAYPAAEGDIVGLYRMPPVRLSDLNFDSMRVHARLTVANTTSQIIQSPVMYDNQLWATVHASQGKTVVEMHTRLQWTILLKGLVGMRPKEIKPNERVEVMLDLSDCVDGPGSEAQTLHNMTRFSHTQPIEIWLSIPNFNSGKRQGDRISNHISVDEW